MAAAGGEPKLEREGNSVPYKQRLEMLIGDSTDNLIKRIMRLILQDTYEAQSELHTIMLNLFDKISINGAEDCRPEAHVFLQRFAEIAWSELVDECFAEGSMKLIHSHSTFFQALGFLRRISCYMPCVKRMWDKRYRIVTNIGIMLVFDGEITHLRHFIWQECLKILYNCLVLCTEDDVKYLCQLQIFNCLEVAWKMSDQRLNLGLLVKAWLVLAEHYHIPICKQTWDRSSFPQIIWYLSQEDEYEMAGVLVARKAMMAVENPEEYKKNPYVHYKQKARYVSTISDIETKLPETFPIICSSPMCNELEDLDCHFRSCERCRLTYYCSKVCQKYHWKHGHKEECIPLIPKEEILKYYTEDVINDFQLYCISLSNSKMLESIMGQTIPKRKRGDGVRCLGVLVKNEQGQWVTIDEQIPDSKKHAFSHSRRNRPKD
ncbi:uncharacterized protein LOC121285573 isoform X1 [Carcharodon carcharias]|uniref:uncharacterized protein LOC121285573 isoform X1 n=2 Tax=Carcharodon carcharias TaxID=13397 RepID=UPI001B7DBA7B|nr:uncharacterized protein LOC121285573 isoform X1 [Carcharodon carcharias]